MLMITTTMGMLDGVHSHTSHLRPAVPLDLVLVVGSSSLQQGLVDTSSSSNDSNHGTHFRIDQLLGARRQLDPGLAGVWVVGDDGSVVTGGSGEFASVTGLSFDVADDGSLGKMAYGQTVANSESGFLSAVDELSGVHSLDRDHQLLPDLVLVGVSEVDPGERGTTAGVVDDVLNDTLYVSVAFSIV